MATDWSAMEVDSRAAFYTDVATEIAALPGVVSAGASSILPVEGRFAATFQHEGAEETPRN